jgi:hypothetical protein
MYVGGEGVVILPPFGSRVYPFSHCYMAVEKLFGSFQYAIAFHAFAHDYSLFMYASIDRQVNIWIQSSSNALHRQHDFFPP